jgi:hypothetical protein
MKPIRHFLYSLIISVFIVCALMIGCGGGGTDTNEPSNSTVSGNTPSTPTVPSTPNQPSNPSTPSTPSAPSDGTPEIIVKPVFFVPSGTPKSDYFKYSEQDKKDLLKSLKIAQDQYKEMLGGKTFSYINFVEVYYSGNTNDYFAQGQFTSPDTFHRIISELLNNDNSGRCDSEYVYLIIYWRTDDNGYQSAGGRTFNGAPGTGGGGTYFDLYDFKTNPFFLSTLIHELGHGFGLLHCDVHGENLTTGKSIMCYTATHHSIDKFTLSADPGILTEEDKYLLSLNTKVFSGYSFTPSRTLNNVGAYLWPMDNPLMSGVHATQYYKVCN